MRNGNRVSPEFREIGALFALGALTLGACGSHPSAPTATGSRQPNLGRVESTAHTRGGVLTVFGRVASIDPASARTELAYAAADATQRPLFSYNASSPARPRPDLAAGPAKISSDGRTLIVRIKRGIHFSPPVDREVTSGDVAYAISRGANPNVGCPFFETYFSTIVGSAHPKGGRLPGLVTPDKHTLIFHLTTSRRTGLLAAALVLPITAPVPQGYATQYDAQRPSRYGDHQVATGPYMFAASHLGRVVGIGYRPGQYARLVRNPNWRANTDFRPAYLNEIRLRMRENPEAAGQRVLAGTSSVQDEPVPTIVASAHTHHASQLQISPGAGLRYIALNNKRGAFSDSDIRKAFWARLDRRAMLGSAVGTLTAQVATHFLYPGVPGFTLAELLLSSRKLLYNQTATGNPDLAGRYMRHAGYPTGRYTGRATLKLVGISGGNSSQAAKVAADALHRLGFRTSIRLVDARAMKSKFCGVPAKEIDVCLAESSSSPVADGQLVLDAPFNGHAMRSIGNADWGQVDSPDLNSAIERESKLADGTLREQGWGAVDNGLVGLAVAVPYAWVSGVAIESKNVAGVTDTWNHGAWDYSFTSLKT